VNISKIVAVTTLCLDDVFVRYVLPSAVHKAACLLSSWLWRNGEKRIIFSRFCVHGDQVSQAKNSKILAVMTLYLDDVCVKYVLPSAVHKAVCL
jgi:hypothetical protein